MYLRKNLHLNGFEFTNVANVYERREYISLVENFQRSNNVDKMLALKILSRITSIS